MGFSETRSSSRKGLRKRETRTFYGFTNINSVCLLFCVVVARHLMLESRCIPEKTVRRLQGVHSDVVIND